ncbi:MAG: hypothetical protein AAGK71_13055 [Pseudomonadota bacterium]
MTLRWNWIYTAILGVLFAGMAFFVFTGVFYFFEPRLPSEAVVLPVTDRSWEGSMRAPSNARFQVQVTLPNGNSAWVTSQPRWVRADDTICFRISEGRWSGAYHLEAAGPGDC